MIWRKSKTASAVISALMIANAIVSWLRYYETAEAFVFLALVTYAAIVSTIDFVKVMIDKKGICR